MKDLIIKSISDSIAATAQLQKACNIEFIENVALKMRDCFQSGRKVIVAGNGGSLCDASHFAEELTGLFRKMRPALPAIALSEPGHITCVANDIGFESVFSRGIEAFGKKGDIFIGLTTSGNSPNIVKAVHKAKEMGLTTVTFLGKSGGKLLGFADFEIVIDGFETSDRIQEAHMVAIHVLIEAVEILLFEKTSEENSCNIAKKDVFAYADSFSVNSKN